MGIKRNLRLRKRKEGGREGKGKMVTVCQIKAEYIGHPHSRGENEVMIYAEEYVWMMYRKRIQHNDT